MSETASSSVDGTRIEFMAASVIHTANDVKKDAAKADFIGVVPLLAYQLCDAGRHLFFSLLQAAVHDPVRELSDEGRCAIQRALTLAFATDAAA